MNASSHHCPASPDAFASPWPLQKGLDQLLHPGDVLSLRGGTYVKTVTMTGRKAAPDNPIVIRSFPGEHAVLDGATIGEFRVVPNESWEPLGDGEFRSRATFMRSEDERARGSFLERVPYARLISYSRIQDLRAENQFFGELPEVGESSELPGFDPLPLKRRRPWVYMEAYSAILIGGASPQLNRGLTRSTWPS